MVSSALSGPRLDKLLSRRRFPVSKFGCRHYRLPMQPVRARRPGNSACKTLDFAAHLASPHEL